jgi:hypothetical protein
VCVCVCVCVVYVYVWCVCVVVCMWCVCVCVCVCVCGVCVHSGKVLNSGPLLIELHFQPCSFSHFSDKFLSFSCGSSQNESLLPMLPTPSYFAEMGFTNLFPGLALYCNSPNLHPLST